MQIVMSQKRRIVYHIARTKEELYQAYSLVYKEYISRGYIPKYYKSKIRLSIYNALPSTTTFVAKDKNKVVATVTLIPDSPIGLPMDKIYKKELDSLRKRGHRLSEVSQLSIDSRFFPKKWFSMFNFSKLMFIFHLFKLVFDYVEFKTDIDEICIAVNPKHQYLYKFLFFEKLGCLKYYGSVNKAPALAFHLSLNPALEHISRQKRIALHKIFYGNTSGPSAFDGKFNFKLEDLKYFFVDKSDIFKKATKEQLRYIKSCYSYKSLDKILP